MATAILMSCPQCDRRYPAGTHLCPEDKALLRPTQKEDPLLGTTLKDAYRVEERIGTGGMATVYRATQLVIDRPVAIKVLLRHLQPDDTFVQRFFREARILGQLNHPNIVSIHDAGQTQEGLVYLVTEFLSGTTLGRIIPPGKGLEYREILDIMRDLCGAVADAHTHDVVHRDLKPSNVFVLNTETRRRRVKVLDFGIAKSLELHAEELTRAGAFVGTPGYMAPEQIKITSPVDHRADVYALGAILYLIAAGKPAFGADKPTERVRQQLDAKLDPVDFAALGKPPQLGAVINKALQTDPEHRFASALDLLDALEHCGDAAGRHSATVDPDATLQDTSYSADDIANWKPKDAIFPDSAPRAPSAHERTRPMDLPMQLKREKRLNRAMLLALGVAMAGASFLLYRVMQLTTVQTEVKEITSVEETAP